MQNNLKEVFVCERDINTPLPSLGDQTELITPTHSLQSHHISNSCIMPALISALVSIFFAADVWAVYGIGLAARDTAVCVVSTLQG
jgi:hypothetical protein